jgi:sugar O-acyltransferase (sialic acid O-acetyltransferase NeuD family)
MKKLLIFGSGNSGVEILKILIQDINKVTPQWEVLGFVDDKWIDTHYPNLDKSKEGAVATVEGYSVFGVEYFEDSKNIFGICGIMGPCTRKKVIEEEIEGKGFQLASLVHPSVIKSDDFVVEPGAVILPNVSISHNVKIGKGLLINYNCVLGHDVNVGSYTTISPSSIVNARCIIGNNCIIGSGATLVPDIKMEDNSLVGAGSTVFSKVKSGTSVTDFPRKITKDI